METASHLDYMGLRKLTTITVHNTTDTEIYSAVYLVEDQEAARSSDILEIDGNQRGTLPRPAMQVSANRMLIASSQKSDLVPLLKKAKRKQLAEINITNIAGSQFYIVQDNKRLKCLNQLRWKVYNKTKKLQRSYAMHDTHMTHEARVRTDSGLAEEEIRFCAQRLPSIKSHLASLFEMEIPDEKVPVIGICCSGGSFRAMYATLGFLRAAKEIGCLDATTYLSVLSGSSWAAFPWILGGKDIASFHESAINKPPQGLWLPTKDVSRAFSNLAAQKYLFSQQVSLVDWYGTLLADRLLKPLGPDRFNVTLSTLAQKDDLALYPLVIGTAAYANPNHEYHPIEFTPFEVGSDALGAYIPSWALGRTFRKGVALVPKPELPLGYFLGIFGSAFSVSVRDILEQAPRQFERFKPLEDRKTYRKLQEKAKDSSLANIKFATARLENFAHGIEDSPMKKQKSLALVDGSFLCNIPIDPLLKTARSVDILIILDNHLDAGGNARHLHLAQERALAQGYKFPPIDFEEVRTSSVSILQDKDDPTCPVVIYVPLRKHEGYAWDFNPVDEKFCSPFNFAYTPTEAKMLSGLTHYVVHAHKDEIMATIKEVIMRKHAS